MFDLGWTELLVIGVVALIVVGPKDLPGMFRAIGNFTGKARRMAREFSRAMNDAADDAGVSEVGKALHTASNPMKTAMDEVRKSTESFTKQTMESGKPKLDPERQEYADKIRKKTAEIAEERIAAEKATDAKAKPAAKKPAAKKPAAKKTAAKKTAAKKPVAKKAPAKTAAAKSATAKKTTTKAASKPAAKPAAKKTAAKKPAAKAPAEDKA